VPPDIRPLTRDDAEAADALAAEAFGAPPRPLPEPWPVPGSCSWGAFVSGELAAVATVRAFRSWFGGEAVPMAGIASVAVRPEQRGAGLLAPLFAALLADARGRGAVISALYPTAPGIYRRLGYEIVGELADVEVPVEPLTRLPAPAGISLRRADPDDERDVGAHRDLYVRWAAAQNGPLTREGALHRPLDGHDTVTLALDGVRLPRGHRSGLSAALESDREISNAVWSSPRERRDLPRSDHGRQAVRPALRKRLPQRHRVVQLLATASWGPRHRQRDALAQRHASSGHRCDAEGIQLSAGERPLDSNEHSHHVRDVRGVPRLPAA